MCEHKPSYEGRFPSWLIVILKRVYNNISRKESLHVGNSEM